MTSAEKPFPVHQFLDALPSLDIFQNIMGIIPITPGFYRAVFSSNLYVTGNNHAVICSLLKKKGEQNLLVLDTKGLPLQAYAALYGERAIMFSEKIDENMDAIKSLRWYFPKPFENALDEREDMSVIETYPLEEISSFQALLRIALGQMVLWSFPMLLFGWQIWLLGLLLLMLSVLLLAAFWSFHLFPVPVRGLAAGSALALLLYGTTYLGVPVFTSWWQWMPAPLMGVWLSVLALGAKP